VRRTAEGVVTVDIDEERVVTLSLARGDEAVLTERDCDGDLTIAPVPLDPRDCNYYGVKECR
jgi:hypothetical protein